MRLLLRRRLKAGREIAGRLRERRGFADGDRPAGRLLWVHAASVGETIAVLPVLSVLAHRPDRPAILLTTGTASSARLLAGRLPALGLVGSVRHRMVPLDVPRWVERFLDAWRPDAAAFVESELWPNTLAALRRRGTPAALVNARLSPRSARGWSHVPGLTREIFSTFTIIWARSDEDRARFTRLGCRVDAVGDLKAAAGPPDCDPHELARWQSVLGDRPRWSAASTHPGEEDIVAAAHAAAANDHARLLTIIAPRHPERGAAIAAMLGNAPRRSCGDPPPHGAGFWLWDTIGELGLLYRLAPLVLVGRSLAMTAPGGQNVLEPARLGCTIATGPYTGNFETAVACLREVGALTVVTDGPSLASWLDRRLNDVPAAVEAGERGRIAATQPSDIIETMAAMLAGLSGAQ